MNETIHDEQMEQDLRDCALDLKSRKSGEDPTLAEEYAMTHVMEAGQYRVPIYIGMIKKLRKDIEQIKKAAHILRQKLESSQSFYKKECDRNDSLDNMIVNLKRDLGAAKRDELRARAGIYHGMVQEMQAAGASGVNLEKVEGWSHIAEKDAADAIQALEDPTRAQRLRKIAHSIKTIIAEARALDVTTNTSAHKAFEGFGDAFEALAEFEERRGSSSSPPDSEPKKPQVQAPVPEPHNEMRKESDGG